MLPRPLVLALAFLTVSGCPSFLPRPRNPLEGVWRVAEIRSYGPGRASTNRSPQPGLFIFTRRHYSMVWTPGSAAREMFARHWSPTSAEKAASFDAIVVNSGTWEREGSLLVTHPIVAKTPDLIGGHAAYECRIVGDTLWLTRTEARSRNGVENPGVVYTQTPVKLLRVE